jgi:hypothetical protein
MACSCDRQSPGVSLSSTIAAVRARRGVPFEMRAERTALGPALTALVREFRMIIGW